MRGTADLPAFGAEVNIAITAEAGITRPLVSGKRHETSGLIELRAQAIQLEPECISNLKIVALMAGRIDKGLVTGKFEVLPGAVGTDGFLRLPVEIGPKRQQRRILDDPQRVAFGESNAAFIL